MPAATQNSHTSSTSTDLAKRAQLPQNIEAEQSVLAACMLSPEATEELILKLKPENFFRPAHRIIFESIYDADYRAAAHLRSGHGKARLQFANTATRI